MLIVMEDRDLHGLAQRLFDVEALGRFDVFEVDAAKSGLEQLAELDDLVRVVRIHFEIEHVDIGEAFEQNTLAFHDWLASERADVAQSEHGGAVAHDRHQIAARGVLVSVMWVLLNFQAGVRYSRGVGQAEIALGAAWLCRCDFDLSRAAYRSDNQALAAW